MSDPLGTTLASAGVRGTGMSRHTQKWGLVPKRLRVLFGAGEVKYP